MKKIDRRKHYLLMVDTETCNMPMVDNQLDISSGLVYDIGGMVVDTKGNVYEEFSFIVKEIFFDECEIMQSAYYVNKLPMYYDDIFYGCRKVENWYNIRQYIVDLMEEYGITEVVAHNARFDSSVLNTTQRWLTKSKYRYFFPYDIVWWDTLKMARSVIGKMPTYKKFCEENSYITKNNQLRFTAEILYRFISGIDDFEENHTGLEDVVIEHEILKYCYRQHKTMKKLLWENDK